jgi:hypothetical protein
MATRKKALAVASAAVVGLVPAFARVSAAQAVQEALATLPVGDELSDEELLQTDGEGFLVYSFSIGYGYCTSNYILHQRGCRRSNSEMANSFGLTWMGIRLCCYCPVRKIQDRRRQDDPGYYSRSV